MKGSGGHDGRDEIVLHDVLALQPSGGGDRSTSVSHAPAARFARSGAVVAVALAVALLVGLGGLQVWRLATTAGDAGTGPGLWVDVDPHVPPADSPDHTP